MISDRPINWNIIGPRVTQARREQNVSMEELCDKLLDLGIEIYPYELSILEEQKRRVLDFELIAMAKALGVSVNWLMERGE